MRHLFDVSTVVDELVTSPDHTSIPKDASGVWIPPVPELMTEELEGFAKKAGVQAAAIPGYWMHKNGSSIRVGAPPSKGEKLLILFHGGAYTALSGNVMVM